MIQNVRPSFCVTVVVNNNRHPPPKFPGGAQNFPREIFEKMMAQNHPKPENFLDDFTWKISCIPPPGIFLGGGVPVIINNYGKTMSTSDEIGIFLGQNVTILGIN